MFGLIPLLVLAQPYTATIDRDAYGVPRITAPSRIDAFYGMGMAVAQDRLWQMEMSRRSARGQLAEVLGPTAVKSDTEVLKRAYTDDELTQMIAALEKDSRDAMEAYAAGVNHTIEERTKAGTLPSGYKDIGFAPRPWTTLDSAAIAVSLMRLFGTGGGAELRNLALVRYMQTRPNKAQTLDILDDLAWQNDPDSPTTVSAKDDPVKNPPSFPIPSRKQTEAHLAQLPATGLLELASGILAADQTDTKLVAETLGVAHHMGSYAVVVAPSRSASGNPILLGAPQMGHSVPSVIHEMVVDAPGFQVAGMDVPGAPGIAIGHTPILAWTLTSGVADIEDVYVAPLAGRDQYKYGDEMRSLDKVTFTLKVKGAADRTVVQERTHHGPVLLKSPGSKAVYSLQSALWKNELSASMGIGRAVAARNPAELDRIAAEGAASFNLFYAFNSGDIGWRYCGHFPLRAPGLDPRFPTPDVPANAWRGYLPADQMPHVLNPSSGLITNWNNKPAAWWPNMDTPVWGRLFRVSWLNQALPAGKLTTSDVWHAAWTIARREPSSLGAFGTRFTAAMDSARGRRPQTPAESALAGFDGWALEGSPSAAVYSAAVRQLRIDLFEPVVGNLTSESLFTQAVQPSLIDRALKGKTKVDYLHGRTADQALVKAFETAARDLGPDPAQWDYRSQRIRVPGEADIPYGNRGTYLQLTELAPVHVARNMVNPGVAESGPHQLDQVHLAREWVLKPMALWKP